ncbi:MAG: hypothetical protein ACOY4K_00665 [Pseudomonadota bacterium]
MTDLATELERLDAALPPGPWTLWTSCSFRRITGPDGKEGGVLHAYNQRPDGHPDLSMPEEELEALVALRNALPGIIKALRDAERGKEAGHEMIADLERRAMACRREVSGSRKDVDNKRRDRRLLAKAGTYQHAAEIAREALGDAP